MGESQNTTTDNKDRHNMNYSAFIVKILILFLNKQATSHALPMQQVINFMKKYSTERVTYIYIFLNVKHQSPYMFLPILIVIYLF